MIEVEFSIKNNEIPRGIKKFIDNYPSVEGAVIFSVQSFLPREYSGKKIQFMKHDEILTFINEYL